MLQSHCLTCCPMKQQLIFAHAVTMRINTGLSTRLSVGHNRLRICKITQTAVSVVGCLMSTL